MPDLQTICWIGCGRFYAVGELFLLFGRKCPYKSVLMGEIMGGEIFNAAILPFVLVLVGLGLGYLLLKLTPEED
jgi:hypothetical protein